MPKAMARKNPPHTQQRASSELLVDESNGTPVQKHAARTTISSSESINLV